MSRFFERITGPRPLVIEPFKSRHTVSKYASERTIGSESSTSDDYIEKGKEATRKKAYEDALVLFEISLGLKGKYSNGFYHCGLVRLFWSEAVGRGKRKEDQILYRDLCEKAVNNFTCAFAFEKKEIGYLFEIYLHRGKAYLRCSQWWSPHAEDAKKDFEKCRDIFDGDCRSYESLGDLHSGTVNSNLKTAIENYRKALKRAPKDSEQYRRIEEKLKEKEAEKESFDLVRHTSLILKIEKAASEEEELPERIDENQDPVMPVNDVEPKEEDDKRDGGDGGDEDNKGLPVEGPQIDEKDVEGVNSPDQGTNIVIQEANNIEPLDRQDDQPKVEPPVDDGMEPTKKKIEEEEEDVEEIFGEDRKKKRQTKDEFEMIMNKLQDDDDDAEEGAVIPDLLSENENVFPVVNIGPTEEYEESVKNLFLKYQIEIQKGYFGLAVQTMEKVLSKEGYENNVSALFKKGIAYSKLGRFREARDLFEKKLKKTVSEGSEDSPVKKYDIYYQSASVRFLWYKSLLEKKKTKENAMVTVNYGMIREDLTTAIECLEKISTRLTRDQRTSLQRCYFEKGEAIYELGGEELMLEALEYYKKCVSVEAVTRGRSRHEKLVMVFKSYRLMGIINYEIVKNYDEAARCCKEAFLIYENDSELNELWGDALFLGTQPTACKDAIGRYNRAIAIKPYKAILYWKRGNTHIVEKEYQEALEDFEHAKLLKKPSFHVIIRQGQVHEKLENDRDAMKFYDEVINAKPVDTTPRSRQRFDDFRAQALCHRSRLYLKKKTENLEYQKLAIEDLKFSIELKPDFTEPWIQLGRMYKEEKDFKSSKECFMKAFEIDRRNPLLHAEIGENLAGNFVVECSKDEKKGFENAIILFVTELRPEVKRTMNVVEEKNIILNPHLCRYLFHSYCCFCFHELGKSDTSLDAPSTLRSDPSEGFVGKVESIQNSLKTLLRDSFKFVSDSIRAFFLFHGSQDVLKFRKDLGGNNKKEVLKEKLREFFIKSFCHLVVKGLCECEFGRREQSVLRTISALLGGPKLRDNRRGGSEKEDEFWMEPLQVEMLDEIFGSFIKRNYDIRNKKLYFGEFDETDFSPKNGGIGLEWSGLHTYIGRFVNGKRETIEEIDLVSLLLSQKKNGGGEEVVGESKEKKSEEIEGEGEDGEEEEEEEEISKLYLSNLKSYKEDVLKRGIDVVKAEIGFKREEHVCEIEGFVYDYTTKHLVFRGQFKGGLKEGKGREHEFSELMGNTCVFQGRYEKGRRKGKGKRYNTEKGIWEGGVWDGEERVVPYDFSCPIINSDFFSDIPKKHIIELYARKGSIVSRVTFVEFSRALDRSGLSKEIKDKFLVHPSKYICIKERTTRNRTEYIDWRKNIIRGFKLLSKLKEEYNKKWNFGDPGVIKDVPHILPHYGVIFPKKKRRYEIGQVMMNCEYSVLGYLKDEKKGIFKSSESDGKLSKAAKIQILLETARGMNFIHHIKLLHRDLKWSNVLLLRIPDGEKAEVEGFRYCVQVMDFDTLREELKFGGKLDKDKNCSAPLLTYWKGTPQYESPEMIAGEIYGRKVDVFSFGIMMYVLLVWKDKCENADDIGRPFQSLVGKNCKGTGKQKKPGSEIEHDFTCREDLFNLRMIIDENILRKHVAYCDIKPRDDPPYLYEHRDEFGEYFGESENAKMERRENPTVLESLMRRCWQINANERPTFSTIIDILLEEKKKLKQ